MSSFSRRLTAVAVCAAISFGGLVVATPAQAETPTSGRVMVQPSNARATVSTTTPGTATIQWDIVHPSAIIYSYTITVYTAVDKTAVATTTTTNIWSRKAVFNGLANGTYYATVIPRNQAGTAGTESDTAPFTIGAVAAPAAPTNVTIGNVSDGFLTVNWSDANRNGANAPTAYRITYTDTVTGVEKTTDVLNNGTLSRQLKVLVHGHAYSVSVSAIKGARRSAEANAAATSIPGLPPKGPSAVTVVNNNDGYLTVNWTDAASTSADAPTSYRITYTDTVSKVAKYVDVLNNGTLSRQLKVLNSGKPYSISVSAIKRGVQSAKKAAAGTHTPAYQNHAPSEVTATSATAGQLTVNWTDSYSNAEGKPTAYRITYTDTVTGIVKTVDVPNDGNKSRTLKTLVGGNAYSVSVAAIRTGGTSTATAAASNVTVKGTAPVAPVSVPANGAVASVTEGLRVTWTAPANTTATGYRVQYVNKSVTPNVTTTVDVANVLAADLTGLTAGHNYEVSIKTLTATGSSSYVLVGTATPQASTPVVTPAAPTNIAVTPGNGTLTVDWEDAGNTGANAALSYNVYVTDETTGITTTVTAAAGSVSKTIDSLDATHTYSVKVSAMTPNGESTKAAAAGTYAPTAAGSGNGSGSGSTPGVCAYQQINPTTGALPAGIVRPGAPTNVQVVANATDPNVLMVDWDAPTNWNGSDAFGYNYVVTDQIITDWNNPQEFTNHILMNSGRGTTLNETIGTLEMVQVAVSNGMIQTQGQMMSGNYQPQPPTTPVAKTLYIYVFALRGTFPENPSETNQPCLISSDLSALTPVAYTFQPSLPGAITSTVTNPETYALEGYEAAPRPFYFPNQVAIPAGVTVSKIQARLVSNNYNNVWGGGQWNIDSPVFDVTREGVMMEGAKRILPSDLLAYVPSTWSGMIQFRVVYSNGAVSTWGVMASDVMVQGGM